MAEQNFKETVEALFQGVDSVVSSKTVVGEPIHIGDVIILPLVDVSFAIGAGSFQSGKNLDSGSRQSDRKQKGAGGMGGKMTPSAVLVIQNGKTKLVNIKNQGAMTKILDMAPDLMDKFSSKKEKKMTEEDVVEILESDVEE